MILKLEIKASLNDFGSKGFAVSSTTKRFCNIEMRIDKDHQEMTTIRDIFDEARTTIDKVLFTRDEKENQS